MAKTQKRQYHRRTDEERIGDLEEKINEIKRRMEIKERQDLPVLREIPKVQRQLRKFAQLAVDHGREDLSNTTMAFVAGLDRVLDGHDMPKRRGRPPKRS